jgi:hypothetical protein
MFVLLRRVRAWREEMLARGAFSPAELSELEDHLLVEAQRLAAAGRPDEEAFTEALRRIGTGEELLAEFRLAHELSGGTAGTWLAALGPGGGRLCRWGRAGFVFCLPGLAMALPTMMATYMLHESGFLREHLPGEPLPGATALVWYGVGLVWRQVWWLLPLVLAVLVLPTAYRIRHLRDRSDGSVAEIIGEELAEARPLLLAGLICYPLTGPCFWQIAAQPLLKLIDMLGG